MGRRACDACTIRKVKCDGSEAANPCSNCRMSGLDCQYLRRMKKRGRPPIATSGPHRHGNHDDGSAAVPSASRATGIEAERLPSPLPGATTPAYLNTRLKTWHQELVQTLGIVAPRSTLNEIVNWCISLCLQNVFPLGPLFCEPAIRPTSPIQWPAVQRYELGFAQHPEHRTIGVVEEITSLRQYAELMAVSASAAFLLPDHLCRDASLVGRAFLQVSREVLKCYHDFDVTYPNASSLVIRICQASALHTDGKIFLAWHTLDEALRLAEQMRLYDERSYDVLEPLEAQLRRLAFWQLYILDKYAALIEGKPTRLHAFSIGCPITTAFRGDNDVHLLASESTRGIPDLEDHIGEGFLLIQKLWTIAADVIMDLQVLARLRTQISTTAKVEEMQRLNLKDSYLRFAAVLDVWPRNLQLITPGELPSINEVGISPGWSFWLQRTHLLVTFHSLKLVFLQRYAELGLSSLIGVTNDPAMLASRKMEIAHDVLNVLNGVPFDCLRTNGESCVAKIRRVGATVLEVMQHVENDQIRARARSLLPELLDILARLNSRASD